MTNSVALTNAPKAANGLTLPLRKFLGSQALMEHRAMVALELEVLAKKLDRFGWDRDRNSPAHDRLVIDWMDALQDYPLDEVQSACRQWVLENPRRMPNEGDVLGVIGRGRAAFIASQPRVALPEPEREKMTAKRAVEIMAEVGFEPKKFGDDAY